jgi:hypothetical protein
MLIWRKYNQPGEKGIADRIYAVVNTVFPDFPLTGKPHVRISKEV